MSAAPVGPPKAAGFLLGLGLGGFFDGIVLHQLLQWHHMASSWHPASDIDGMQLNTTLDGAFHATTYVFVLLGIILLWKDAPRGGRTWSLQNFVGCLLCGFGAFNLTEGLINHQILGLHHVNETAPRALWIYWDLGFLIWGAAMVAAGVALVRQADRLRGR